MLFRIKFDIGIYPDRVQVTDHRRARFVDFQAEVPFSAPDRLVADPVYFENALAKAIRKALKGGFILLDSQANVTADTGLLDADGRELVRRALRDIGFRTVKFEGSDEPEPAPALLPGLAELIRARL